MLKVSVGLVEISDCPFVLTLLWDFNASLASRLFWLISIPVSELLFYAAWAVLQPLAARKFNYLQKRNVAKAKNGTKAVKYQHNITDCDCKS